MKQIDPCRVCDKPGNLDHTVTTNFALFGSYKLKPSKWQYYCSKECNYRETWKLDVYLSGLAGFVIIILMAIGLLWWFGIVILLIISVGLLFYANFKRTYWLRDDLQYNGVRSIDRNSDLPSEKEVSVFEKGASVSENQENKIYSDILEKEVRECCHQTARLKDKYCVCGRALEYPTETN